MQTNHNSKPSYIANLSQSEVDSIYRSQHRAYWEADFVNRCIDRYHEGAGLCNIPLESVADNTALLDMAYGLYADREDSNVAYNDMLDAAIDEIEKHIAKNGVPLPEFPGLEADEKLNEKKVQVVHLMMVKDMEICYGEKRMQNPKDAAGIISEFLGDVDRECVVMCALDMKMNPLCIQVTAVGSISQCPVSIPDIFKAALLSNASNILLFHNHLSGDVLPSKADVESTERVKKAGEILGIRLVDHIIVGGNNAFYSFHEAGSLH